MKQVLTKEQKRLGQMYTSLKEQAGWQDLVSRYLPKIKELEDILLGKVKIKNAEDPTKAENLDEIKYSMNSVLRKELTTLRSIIEYPDLLIKSQGFYKQDDDTK